MLSCECTAWSDGTRLIPKATVTRLRASTSPEVATLALCTGSKLCSCTCMN